MSLISIGLPDKARSDDIRIGAAGGGMFAQLDLPMAKGAEMRRPRVRFTIGGMMVLVLVAALALWGRRLVQSRLTPSIAEQRAEADYKQALLTREVAEYAVKEYQEGTAAQADAELDLAIRSLDAARIEGPGTDMPIVRWRGDSRTPPAARRADPDGPQSWPSPKQVQAGRLQSLRDDVGRAQADELIKREAYRAERARRMSPFGF